MIGYIPRWFIRPQTVTHPTTNPAVHGRESNSQPVVDEEEEKDERKKKGKVKETKTFLESLSYTIIGG